MLKNENEMKKNICLGNQKDTIIVWQVPPKLNSLCTINSSLFSCYGYKVKKRKIC